MRPTTIKCLKGKIWGKLLDSLGATVWNGHQNTDNKSKNKK